MIPCEHDNFKVKLCLDQLKVSDKFRPGDLDLDIQGQFQGQNCFSNNYMSLKVSKGL